MVFLRGMSGGFEEALKPRYIEQAMRITKMFGAWSSKDVRELSHCTVENILCWQARCQKGSGRLVLQRKNNGVVLICPMVEATSGQHRQWWFCTKSAEVEEILLNKIVMGN